MNDVIVQIYGIKTIQDARRVVDLGADHIGVSFGETTRTPGQLSGSQARELFSAVQPRAVKVGLTVSESLGEITRDLKAMQPVQPDVLHLSGDIEGLSPEDIAVLRDQHPGLKIMQAIPVLPGVPLSEQKALEYVRAYEAVSDFFLIDTKVPDATDIGATGITHDWSIDRAIIEMTEVRSIIAGGLDASNVAAAIEATRPYGADSFSWTNYDAPRGEPTSYKDPAKVKAFVEAARGARL